jgi:hypothetical protein
VAGCQGKVAAMKNDTLQKQTDVGSASQRGSKKAMSLTMCRLPPRYLTPLLGKYGKWMGINYAEKNPYYDMDSFLRRITADVRMFEVQFICTENSLIKR